MNAKGLIFDYGGTIDTNSVHWSEVLWDGFVAADIQVEKTAFREAYVYGEQTLAKQPLILPHYTMLDLLRIKVNIETRYLREKGFWKADEAERVVKAERVAYQCYEHVQSVINTSREVLLYLADRYSMALVSNFYGNIHAVLRDFHLECFPIVIESAVVGIRKPDPRIFQMGIDALGLKAEDTIVIGDSYSKDIVPAATLGCQTIWLRGAGWENETVEESLPTAIISNIQELTTLL